MGRKKLDIGLPRDIEETMGLKRFWRSPPLLLLLLFSSGALLRHDCCGQRKRRRREEKEEEKWFLVTQRGKADLEKRKGGEDNGTETLFLSSFSHGSFLPSFLHVRDQVDPFFFLLLPFYDRLATVCLCSHKGGEEIGFPERDMRKKKK